MAWFVVPGAALVLLLALLARQLEGRRLASKRRFHSPTAAAAGQQVSIIIPLAGLEHQLRDNLASWLLQDWPEREIIFVAESPFDAAVPVAQALVREHRHVPAQVVFSGTTATRGQRVHQLLRGIEAASTDSTILALGSADAKVQGDAVRWMAHHLAEPAAGAVTGNLWSVPRLQSPANRLAAALGNLVAGLAGPGRWNLINAGGWAIRRADFERLGLASVWSTALTETWCSRRALLRAGLAVRFEPHCIAESTIETSPARIFQSGLRKNLAARQSAPLTWGLALTATVAIIAGLAIAVANAVSSFATGQFMAGLLATGQTLAIYGMGVAAGLIRQRTARRLLPAWKHYRSARRFDVQWWPVTALVAIATMLGSLVASHVRWRGKCYQAGYGGLVRFEGSIPWENILRPGIRSETSQPETVATLPIERNASPEQRKSRAA